MLNNNEKQNDYTLVNEAKSENPPYVIGDDLRPKGSKLSTKNGMLFLLPNYDEQVKRFKLKEVSNPEGFLPGSGTPTEDGLFSVSIFGDIGSEERFQNRAYLSLGDRFIHPFVFGTLKRLSKKKKMEDLVFGRIYAAILGGDIVFFNTFEEIPDKYKDRAGTGSRFLYDFFESINWKKVYSEASERTRRRAELLEYYTRDHIFMDKFEVCPAGYRDASDPSGITKNEINTWLGILLRNRKVIEDSQKSSFASFSETEYMVTRAHQKTMNTLQEINDYMVSRVLGADGTIRDTSVGKATKWSSRLVISNPPMNTNTAEECPIQFGQNGVPLSSLLACNNLLVQYEAHKLLESYIHGEEIIFWYNEKSKKLERAEVYGSSGEDILPSDELEDMMINYDHDMDYRFTPITFRMADPTKRGKIWVKIHTKTLDGEEKTVMEIYDSLTESKEILDQLGAGIIRPMNLIEFFFIATYNSVRPRNKEIPTRFGKSTRYPIDDHNSTVTAVPVPIAYVQRGDILINGFGYDHDAYPHFPLVKKGDEKTPKSHFIESLMMNPLYLSGLSADFDGDQMSNSTLYSDEANIESSEQLDALNNVLGIDGKVVRRMTAVMEHTLNALTRDIDEKYIITLKGVK